MFLYSAVSSPLDYSITLPIVYIARYSFIQLSEPGCHGENENAQVTKQQQRGFERRLSGLRVRHSTTELPRSTQSRIPCQINELLMFVDEYIELHIYCNYLI